MVDRPESRYPYSDDGVIAVPADADWLDPLVTLSFAAAATERIRLATGVLLLPEHNPVLLAKQAASVDVLSGGRLTLGVGVGWSREEFEALGVPFARRGRRADEYLAGDAHAVARGRGVVRRRVRVVRSRARQSQAGARPEDPDRDRWQQRRRAASRRRAWRRLVRVQPQRGRGGPRPDRDAEGPVQRARALDRRAGGGRRARGGWTGRRRALAEIGVDELVLVAGPPEDPGEADGWAAALASRWTAATF